MADNKNELKPILFGLVFSILLILSTAFISYPIVIVNIAYAILVVTLLLSVKYLIDSRKKSK